MTDTELIERLKSIRGQTITGISYIRIKFHYPNPGAAQGDWTNVHPDRFVLHSPEWQIKLGDGQALFISSEQIGEERLGSRFEIKSSTNATEKDTVLSIPKAFQWLEILDKPIKNFRLWQRVIKTPKFLYIEYKPQYQQHFQIIELICGDKKISLTLMDGDIGDSVFYPTGYLGDRVGVFFNKAVCTSHTVYDLTMRMASTYQST